MRIAVCLITFGMTGAQAAAETLFSEDFQSGTAENWSAGGDGEVGLSTYAGNVSMRLTKSAYAIASFSLTEAEEVVASASFAADDLEKGEACLAEISVDGGKSWYRIAEVGDGRDDAVTMHADTVTLEVPEGASTGFIGLRINANGANDTCWADNIRVVGRKAFQSSATPGERTELTAEFLGGNAPMKGLVNYAAFARAESSTVASNAFSGRLSFAVSPDNAGFEALHDALRYADSADESYKVPPKFDFEFVQVGARLAPAKRGLNQSPDHNWEWVVEPGYIWDEPDDGGFSRAAIPFALQERNANCAHNGVLTFLFKSTGEISRVAYQIAQETCSYFKFNAWGVAAADYAPGDVANAEAIAEALQAEIASRLPTRPIAEIGADHPGLDASQFGSAADVSPENMTLFGVVLDGVHYVGGCGTRAGLYPYCDEMDLPSYSTAKTIVAGLAYMRLALLNPAVRNARIADYVPACAAAGDWEDVTFEHALDMTTGRYDSTKREADEDAMVSHGFFLVPDHASKIDMACTKFPRRTEPGEVWVYHTTDTYALGTAMQAFWRKEHGSEADFFDNVLVRDLFTPLALSPTIAVTKRTYDSAAQPFAGWGLTYLRDDIAKIAQFLARDLGARDGAPLIDRDLIAAGLQRDPNDLGLSAAGPLTRYNNGIWAWNIQGYMGCTEPTFLPFMSGFGGISVVMLPGGAVYYYFSDGVEFRWARAAAELNKVQPFCRK